MEDNLITQNVKYPANVEVHRNSTLSIKLISTNIKAGVEFDMKQFK